LNLIPADIGRRLQEIRPNLDAEDIDATVQATIDGTTLQEREVREKDGPWYLMRVRTYKTWDNKIDGAVISFQDIDELKRTVNASRNYAETLIENAREAILILDSNLKVSSANPAFHRMFRLSKDQVEGHAIGNISDGRWTPPGLREKLHEILRKDTRLDDSEVRHEFPELGTRTMLFNARRIEPNRGQHVVLLSIEDITEQKQHIDDLQTHSALLKLASDGVFVRDFAGTIQLWNNGAERLYGWSKEEALGRRVSELLKTKYPIPLEDIKKELQRTGYWEGELIHTRKDGQERVVESRWSLHRKEPPTILELNTDITNRRMAEEQLRKLSGQLMQAQDEERRRIARDLHDSTGQKLVALKMSLQDSNVGKSAKAAIKLADEALQEIRTLAQLLHPPLLEEAGLISATQYLADGFSSRAGIDVELKSENGIERLPADLELVLFRVIQESLNNIHRHSGAKRAKIEFLKSDSSLALRIKDDGRGMPKAQPPGVGLLGMRERLSQAGGKLTINSNSKGTTVEAIVPLK